MSKGINTLTVQKGSKQTLLLDKHRERLTPQNSDEEEKSSQTK